MTEQRLKGDPQPELVNFSWALLVSLHIHIQDHPSSDIQQHVHIMRWLSNARKRHVFPKSLATEIDWFIKEGRRKGWRAGLRAKAEYIWHTATGTTQQQSDLRRLTFFFEAIQKMGWQDELVSDVEWLSHREMTTALPTVFLRKSELHGAFDNSESMIHPLTLRLNQPGEDLKLIARDSFFTVEVVQEDENFYTYIVKTQA